MAAKRLKKLKSCAYFLRFLRLFAAILLPHSVEKSDGEFRQKNGRQKNGDKKKTKDLLRL